MVAVLDYLAGEVWVAAVDVPPVRVGQAVLT